MWSICIPEAFTADHKPLMGESPELRGFYLGCGFNSSGMMLSKSASAAQYLMTKRAQRRRKHCALAVVRRSQKFRPAADPLPGGA